MGQANADGCAAAKVEARKSDGAQVVNFIVVVLSMTPNV